MASQVLSCKNGIPSYDTINWLLVIFAPDLLYKNLVERVASIRKTIDNEEIAVNIKVFKGLAEPSKGMKVRRFAFTFAAKNELVLAQEMNREKSDEIKVGFILPDIID